MKTDTIYEEPDKSWLDKVKDFFRPEETIKPEGFIKRKEAEEHDEGVEERPGEGQEDKGESIEGKRQEVSRSSETAKIKGAIKGVKIFDDKI